jgi:hypothetical protein
MKGTDGSFVLVGFSKIGTERLNNRSGKCEEPGGGLNEVKNRSGKCARPGWRGDQRLFEKIKVFFKNQKHEPNIVQITHLCIMHGVHTSIKQSKVSKFAEIISDNSQSTPASMVNP